MEIEDLIRGTNEKLYHSVREHLKVTLIENIDWREEAWSSSIDGDTTIITYCSSKFPKAAFAHELLNIHAQIKGFKKISFGDSLDKEVQYHLPTLVKCMNQHFLDHKIAKAFLTLDYPPQQFYDYELSSEFDFIQGELNTKAKSLISLSILYLSFLTPCGDLSPDQKQALQKSFEQYEGGKYKQTLSKIDEILSDWVSAETFNAEYYLIDFCLNLGIKATWFSYKHDAPGMYQNEFPACGFFVGEAFTLEEIRNVYED